MCSEYYQKESGHMKLNRKSMGMKFYGEWRWIKSKKTLYACMNIK